MRFLGLVRLVRRPLRPLAVLIMSCAAPGAAQFGPMTFSVQVKPAEQREVARSLEFSGSIQPWRTIEVSTRVEGLVEQVPIEEGMPLAGADLICRLDAEPMKIAVDRARASVDAARAELDRLTAGYRPEEIEEARRALEASRADLQNARDEWERQRPLVERGVISPSEGTRVKALFERADAAVARDQARLDLLEAGYRGEEVLRATAQLRRSQAELADAERRRRHAEIVAPLDCVVTDRLREPGEWVAIGDPVARVVVLEPLKVRIEVPQIYYSKVREGQNATLKVDGMPDTRFVARVDHIIPNAGEATRNFPVLLRLENEDRRLISGLFARVLLNVGEARPTVLVPREALLIRGDALVVLVAEPIAKAKAEGRPPAGEGPRAGDQGPPPGAAGGGSPGDRPPPPPPDATIREVEVRTGTEIGEMVAVEVVKGEAIQPGDRIVVLGGTRLSNGMPVRIIETGDADAPTTHAAGGTPAS